MYPETQEDSNLVIFIINKLKIVLQYLIPQHFLSRLVYQLTRCSWPFWKNLIIKLIIKIYRVDLGIAKESDYRNYESINHFFTRELLPSARPVTDQIDAIVSPVDGAISQIGAINNDEIFQAKGQAFNLEDLLVVDKELSSIFQFGNFSTIYLSPRDYHRIHMPLDGRLNRMVYVPDRLFSVNKLTTQAVPRLFSRNERLINIFDTKIGKMAVIFVGAIFVGSMETVWAGQITPASKRDIAQWDYQKSGEMIVFRIGQELGRFNMGSTVIVLFERGKIEWQKELLADSPVVMGQTIAKIKYNN